MLQSNASRLRAFIAAIGLMTCTLAGAGADNTASPLLIGTPATHNAPHGDTPHDSFAASAMPETHATT